MNKKILFIVVAVVLVVVFAGAATLFNKEKSAKDNAFVSQNIDALYRIGAPVKGPKDAKVTIVEFFDPACGTCSQFYPLVNDLVKKYPGKVKVMMRYAPLHQGSDQVVKMLEAAHLQGKFWSALELLFANQQRWIVNHVSQPDSARLGLMTAGLKQEQFTQDWQSEAIAKIVEQDIQDSKILNVRATPEFFVNGKPMPSFGYQQLVQLVEEAIAEEY